MLTAQASGVEARLIGISPVDENIVWISGTGGTYLGHGARHRLQRFVRRGVLSHHAGGPIWARVPPDRLPPASEGEGSFAASGTCLVTHGEGTAWVGTGADASARVMKTTDRGRSWTVADTPIVGGTPTAGIASLAFRDANNGAAFGGVIDEPDEKEERPGQSLKEKCAGAFRLLDHRPQDALHEPTHERRRVRGEVIQIGGRILGEPDPHHRHGGLWTPPLPWSAPALAAARPRTTG